MGLPKKHRKKYLSHKERWDKQTIEEEKVLVRDYALKNKKEIRRVEAKLKKFKEIAKSLNVTKETKESDEAKKFIAKLKRMGFLKQDAESLDEILDITIRELLDRRLSNILYKLKLARTPKQARQFVVHGHVKIGSRSVNSPSYLTSLEEESMITFSESSPLLDEEHPERVVAKGGMIEVKEMEKIPLKDEEESFDEKEAVLDDEEADEVDLE